MTLAATAPRSPETGHPLPYGDLAIALYASNMTFPPPPLHAVAAHADEGLHALGGTRAVRDLHERWLQLNNAYMRGHLTPGEYEDATNALWPDSDRLEHCIGYDMGRLLPT